MPLASLQPSAEVVVRLLGDLDLSGHERWGALLRDAAGLLAPVGDPAVVPAPAPSAPGARPSLLVVDLGDVEFADCTGLQLLEELRATTAGRLVLRRPSAAVLRLLRLTSSEGFPVDEEGVTGTGAPRAGAVGDGAGRRSSGVDVAALQAAVERLGVDLVAGATTADVLEHLTTAAARVVDLDGTGVVLVGPDGRLRLAQAQGEGVLEVELVQERFDLGPCRDSHGSGDVVGDADLAVEGARWPAYRARAVSVGLRGVTAVPLRARGRGWGVLDVYRRAPRPLDAEELAALRALAALATSCLVLEADRRAGAGAPAHVVPRA